MFQQYPAVTQKHWLSTLPCCATEYVLMMTLHIFHQGRLLGCSNITDQGFNFTLTTPFFVPHLLYLCSWKMTCLNSPSPSFSMSPRIFNGPFDCIKFSRNYRIAHMLYFLPLLRNLFLGISEISKNYIPQVEDWNP